MTNGGAWQDLGNRDGTNSTVSPFSTHTLTVGGSGSRALAAVAVITVTEDTAADRDVRYRIVYQLDGGGTTQFGATGSTVPDIPATASCSQAW